MTRILVTRVTIPAMSTVGQGFGYLVSTGKPVSFFGDHRPMHRLGLALQDTPRTSCPPIVELEGWQTVSPWDDSHERNRT